MNDQTHEEWRPIEGYPDYEVSNCGRVKSLKGGKERILRPGSNNHGYPSVALCVNGKPTSITVHKLVAEFFLGKRPENHEVNHKDGNRANAHVDNLEYVTRSENVRHAIDILDRRIGSHKLTDDDVIAIIHLLNTTNVKLDEIAARFGVNPSNVSAILAGKTWKQYAHLITPNAYKYRGQIGRPRRSQNGVFDNRATPPRIRKAENLARHAVRDTRVMLMFYDGYSQRAIAKHFNLSQAGVAKIIKALRPQMEGQQS